MHRDHPAHEESREPLSGFIVSFWLDPETSLLPIALAMLITQLDTKCTSLDSKQEARQYKDREPGLDLSGRSGFCAISAFDMLADLR